MPIFQECFPLAEGSMELYAKIQSVGCLKKRFVFYKLESGKGGFSVKYRPVRDIDAPTVADRRDERLLHRRDPTTVRTFDLHRVPDPEHPLLDPVQLAAVGVFQGERLADPERLAVYLEGVALS